MRVGRPAEIEPQPDGRESTWWIALGPLLLAALLVVRAVAVGGDDATMLLAIAAVTSALAIVGTHVPWLAPLVLVAGPIALLASPARTELSFSLSRPGDTAWFVFALLVAGAVGTSLVAAVAVLARRRVGPFRLGPRVAAGLAVGAVGTVGFALLVVEVDPQPDLGRGLTDAERAALPVVDLVNFAYAIDPTGSLLTPTGRLAFVLDNPSDLPHTFTVDAIDLDVYVPAGRSAVVDVELPSDIDRLDVHCAVSEHRALGMVARIDLTR
jgi:hypothetical protein